MTNEDLAKIITVITEVEKAVSRITQSLNQLSNEKIINNIAEYLKSKNTSVVNQAFKDTYRKVRYDTCREALLPEDSWLNLTVAEIISFAAEMEEK